MARGDAHISALIDIGERMIAMERLMADAGWTVLRTIALRASDSCSVTILRDQHSITVARPSMHDAMAAAMSAALTIGSEA